MKVIGAELMKTGKKSQITNFLTDLKKEKVAFMFAIDV